MNAVKEFKVNEYITLKLENKKTVVYVAGERFNQCKYLFIINPNDTITKEINSIDDIILVKAFTETIYHQKGVQPPQYEKALLYGESLTKNIKRINKIFHRFFVIVPSY